MLAVHGEQGSAKSTVSRILRILIDPNVVPLRSDPRDEVDLVIAATNGWIVALDNLSTLRVWLSDGLCRLATGGGLGKRQLYTDGDEVLFDVQRPVVVNGIAELATRGDLLDRAIPLVLPVIPEEKRRPESEFWADFRAAGPQIFGGLLDAVAGMLAKRDGVHLKRLPRMADFAITGTATERALGWQPESFIKAYQRNRASANAAVLDASPVAEIIAMLDLTVPWNGKAGALLKYLESLADDAIVKKKGWPADGARLSGMLRRVAPNLRAVGIEVEFDTPRRRYILIRLNTKSSDTSDLAKQQRQEPLGIGENGRVADRVADDADVAERLVSDTVQGRDGTGVQGAFCVADDADVAEIPTHSNEPDEGVEF